MYRPKQLFLTQKDVELIPIKRTCTDETYFCLFLIRRNLTDVNSKMSLSTVQKGIIIFLVAGFILRWLAIFIDLFHKEPTNISFVAQWVLKCNHGFFFH